MSPFLRSLLKKLVPASLLRRRSEAIGREMQRQEQMAQRLYACCEGRVLSGPFKGLVYSKSACGSMLGPKLLGSYECELAGVIDSLKSRTYAVAVDVGAAEGYYAVGLLRHCPAWPRLIAFESEEHGRAAMAEMQRANGVDARRLEVRGRCEAEGLREALAATGHTLLICDIEGGEKELLDPAGIPALRHCDILVEVHDFIDLGISATLLARFGASHTIERLRSRERTRRDVTTVPGFADEELVLLASERRPCTMEWFWMQARAAGAGGEL